MPDRSTTHAAHLDDSMAADTESLTRGAPAEPSDSAPAASRVASVASTGVRHEVGCIGLRAARLPFVVIERGARAVLDILPRP